MTGDVQMAYSIQPQPRLDPPVPHYVTWPARIGLGACPPAALTLALGVVVVLCYEALRWATGHRAAPNERKCIYGACVMIVTGMFFLNHGYRKAAAASSLFHSKLAAERDQRAFHRALTRMFSPAWQDPFAAAFALALLLIVLGLDPRLDAPMASVVLVLAGLAGLVSGWGLGLAVTTLFWIASVGRYKSLQLFVLPGRTPALRAAASVTGVFALYFSLQSAIEIGVFLWIPWANVGWVQGVQFALMWPVIVVVLVFLVVPQWALRRVIVEAKEQQLAEIEMALGEAVSPEDVALHGGGWNVQSRCAIADFYSRVDESPSTALDLETVHRFFWSFLVPLLALMHDAENIRFVQEHVLELLRKF